MKVPFLDLNAQTEELRSELDNAIKEVLDSGRFILGPEVSAFEREFASYCGCREAIGTASGLDALKLILRALDIGPGDEVVTAANSFIASALAICSIGAVPVLADVDERTGLLTAETVAPRITARTKALMPVHLYGQPAEMEPLRALVAKHGLFMVEDACQAHGARYQGRRAGGLGTAAAFSFYPGKNLGAFGDGGAVTTDDPVLAERVRTLRNYGSAVKYYHEELGENSRLDTLQAAVLSVKLHRLDVWNEHRRKAAARYRAGLEGLSAVRPMAVSAEAEPVYHLFVVAVEERDALMRHLADCGVESLIHYPVPIHLQRAYLEKGWRQGDFPVAERLAEQILSLPIGPHITDEQVDYVCESIGRWVLGTGR